MAIKRGTNTIRRHGKNYTSDIAQRRLDEVVKPFNEQVVNSLAVNAVEIDYYSVQKKIGRPCSCDKTNIKPNVVDYESNVPPIIPSKDADTSGIKVKFQDTDIFGDSMAEKIFNDTDNDYVLDVSGEGTHLSLTEDDIYTEGAVSGGGVNCGICYRTGMQPPFKAYGKQRVLLTHEDIVDCNGYFTDSTQLPHKIMRHDPELEGYVVFEFSVPKYWTTAQISIRDNLMMLSSDRLLMLSGMELTGAELRMFSGRNVSVMVKSHAFTHVVIEFEYDVPPLLANISGEQMMLDYDRLQTISDINVVLPPTIAEVETGDVLVIRKRNLVLKIRDKERKITADKRRLGWTVSTRVLQPTEPLRNINKSYKLY
jgi:hypothetical protein